MDAIDIYNLKEYLSRKNIILCYSGIISQSIIEEIAEGLKSKMEMEDVSMSINMRLFSVFIEQVQNIMKYSSETTFDEVSQKQCATGIIIVGSKNNEYFSITGNVIDSDAKEQLKGRLDKILSMDKNDLKEYYKELIQKDKDEKKLEPNGGLGLVFMARKASKPIEYHIENINETSAFYVLQVTI